MKAYVLNVATEHYGPYPSESLAEYARAMFARHYPDLADECSIAPIISESVYLVMRSPILLN